MPALPLAATALPALKPNQPTHNRLAPISVIARLCGGIIVCGKPRRLPIISAATSPATPALMCTTVPPAKWDAAVPEQAAGAGPGHMRQRQVGEAEPQGDEGQQRPEAHAFGEGADDQRRGDRGKGQLEHGEHRFRDPEHQAVAAQAGEEGAVQAADEPCQLTCPATMPWVLKARL